MFADEFKTFIRLRLPRAKAIAMTIFNKKQNPPVFNRRTLFDIESERAITHPVLLPLRPLRTFHPHFAEAQRQIPLR